MNLMRNALLWASQNKTLQRHVPRWPFVRRALRKFMPGEQLDDALAAAADLAGRGVTTTFTALGENVTTLDQAEAVTDHYLTAYDRIAGSELDTEVSVKLTQLGLDVDAGATAKNTARLAERAEALGNWLWIDMEASEYVDATLAVLHDLKAGHGPLGVCLQAYLHRTTADIEQVLAMEAGIRLVKGAYRETEAIALTDRKEIDDAFFRHGTTLLAAAKEGARIALATHDVPLLERLAMVADTLGLARDDYGIQMLYGIRTQDQLRLAADGHDMRTLVAYGEHWYPWYVRRLAERPANLWFVARNAFARGTSR